jgi:hypothetical protein
MAVHVLQARSFVPAHAVLSYSPTAQAALQVAQLSAVSLTRYVPLVHVVHCWSVAFVQVRPAVQPVMAVQAVQVLPSTK